jgi:hypothetical protein
MTIIEDLEQQVEHWRQRAEVAEAIVKGEDWNVAVPPLSLQQTRVMRYIARKPIGPARLVSALACDYPMITPNSLTVTIWRCRQKLPAHIAPRILPHHAAPFEVPDRAALKAWLETGQLPDRRAA